MKNLFTESDGRASWRKIMTASALVVFLTATLGWLIKHGFDELPSTYSLMISGVFVFYFGKKAIDKLGTRSSQE